MHATNNPFMPKSDAEIKETIICDNLIDEFNRIFNDPNQCRNSLPKDYSFQELSWLNNGNELLTYINKYYYNNDTNYAAMNYGDDLRQFFIELDTEVIPYVIKYKSTIIALQVLEYVDIQYDTVNYKAAHADFLIIHPKFRHTFLINIFTTIVYGKGLARGCQIEFWTAHTKLHFQPYITKSLYNLPLSNMVKQAGLTNSDVKHYKHNPEIDIEQISIDNMNIFNNQRYKLQCIYSDNRLKSMHHNYICLTDSEHINMVIINKFHNIINKFSIKTCVIIDYIKHDDKSFREFMIEVIIKLINLEYDLITITRTDSDDLLMKLGFEKNSEMNYYMMNFIPIVKHHEIMLTFR